MAADQCCIEVPSMEGLPVTGERAPSGLAAWQLNRLLDYIQNRLDERLVRRELARVLSISVGRLSTRFKISTGMTLRQYIALQRVTSACGMMQSGSEPLARIAVACGLCDQAHFSRVFRSVIGVSPAAWRRAHLPSDLLGRCQKSSA